MIKIKNTGLFALAFYLSLTTWIVFRYTKQTYGVNDDVIIQNWLSGFFTGQPEFMIRGSATPRISFGFVVSNLYNYFPSINWFSVILLLFTLLSWFMLGTMAVKAKNYFVMVIYGVLSFLHLSWFIPSPTYTATAVILSFSSLVFLSKRFLDKTLNSFDLIIVLAYVFSFFIRPESFLLGTAVASPILIYTASKNRQFIKIKSNLIIIIIAIITFLISIDFFSESLYYKSNPDWSEYKRWEQARYAIQANSPEKILAKNPSEFGWTMAEFELFKNYNSVDINNFNYLKFEKLIDETMNRQVVEPISFLKQAHQQIFDSDVNWEWKKLIQLITFIFILFLILSVRSPKDYLFLTTVSLFVLYSIMLYVAGFLRQPERVQVSVIFLAILVSWVSFVFTSRDKNTQKHVDPYAFLTVLLVVLVVGSALPQLQYLKNKVAGASNVFWQKQRIYLSEFPKDSIFVGNASQFRNNWISPYKMEYYDVEKRIFTLGWHNFSPHWTKRAISLGLNPQNIFQSVISDPRVYWVSDPESMKYIIEYMKENNYDFSGPEIVGEIEYVGSRYVIWDFGNG